MNDDYDHIRDYVVKSVGDDETRLLISDFAILWNEYEDELYNGEHHIKSIPRTLKRLNVEIDSFENKISNIYFRLVNYIKSKGEFSFDGIVRGYNVILREPVIENGKILKYDNGEIIYRGEITELNLKRIINSDMPVDRLHFMLFIAGRVRNNMFHGSKGIYTLKEQKELFKACNETLKLVLDIKRRYGFKYTNNN